jgi:RHS repeat-associated protein
VNTAVTTYVYANSTSTCGNAFPTTTNLPLSLAQQSTWNCTGAVLASSTDVNGNKTSYQYTDANYWRLTKIVFPDSTSDTESFSYATGPSFPWTVTTSKAVDSSQTMSTINYLDGLGRTYANYVSDPDSSSSYRQVWTTYDAVGRVHSVTNPFFTTSDPTYGTTLYTYDGLSRVTKVTNPDTTYKSFSYTNRAAEAIDEAGITKVFQIDGLGRLVNVCDGVNATAQANGPAPSTCTGLDIAASGFLATYVYDPLGNITSATIGASTGYTAQTRSYTYDGLSRITGEKNPETGSISCNSGTYSVCYTYDGSSAVGDLYQKTFPKPNQTGTTTITQTNVYDALHRITGVSFSDGSPGTTYYYDASTATGTWGSGTLTNTKGRLMEQVQLYSGGSVFSYDTMGRVTDNWQCTETICGSYSWHSSTTYNYVDEPTLYTDAKGTAFSYYYNATGHLTEATSSWIDTTHPQVLFSGATYNPFGALANGTYGDNNGTGTVRTNTYDTLGRLTEIQDGSAPTYRLFLGYYADSSVSSYQDNVTGLWNYTYDAFNRLATAVLTQTGNPNAPSYSYSYDQFGNRWHQHLTAGTGYDVLYSFNGNNRNITSGFAYDAAGNLTSDGTCSPCWTYDDFGNLSTGNGATFSYDALGRRTQKVVSGTTYNFVLGLDGTPFNEYQGESWTRTTGGGFTYANNSTYFNRTDNLGTPRLSTDYTGTVQRTEGVLMGPFGDGFSETMSTLDFTGFAGGFWDSENNSDHFGAREYAKTQGRWLIPDPAGLAVVDPNNPQTWNRYAYVGNNPATFIDPSGLVDINAAMAFFAGGGGGMIGGCTQDGVDSNCVTNIFLVSDGAAVNCPQCAPGTPGGVAVVGTIGSGIYQYVPNGTTASPDGFTLYTGNGVWRQVGTLSAAPDFISLNINVGIPVLANLVGGTLAVNVGRHGNVYVGGGANVGKSLTFISGSLTANWFPPFANTNANNFLTKNSFSVAGGWWGGLQGTYTPGSGTALGAGVVSPQIGGAWTYSWNVGNLGIGW